MSIARGSMTIVRAFIDFAMCPCQTDQLSGPGARYARGYAAWDKQVQIYFAHLQSGKAAVDAPKAVRGHGGNRKHPAMTVNKNGDVIVVWTEGTGWNRGGDLA